MAEEQALPVISYQSFPMPSWRGKGFLAVCGTFLLAGVGHWIVGAKVRAIVWLLISLIITAIQGICLTIPRLFLVGIRATALNVIFLPWLLIDAYLTGRRSPRRLLPSPWARYAVGTLLIAFSLPLAWGKIAVIQHVFGHWVKAFKFTSQAMSPNLLTGDRFLCNKRLQPRRWDMVVFLSPENTWFIMRVAGLPGETVEMASGGLKINGQIILPPSNVGPYVRARASANGRTLGNRPIHLGPDEYFVLGDNSRIARDSRYLPSMEGHQAGAVPADRINGVVTAIYWPPSRIKQLVR